MLNIDNEFSKIKDYSFFNRAMFLFENNKYVNAIFVNEIVDKEYSDFSRCVNVTFDNIERCITLENIKEEGIYLSTEIKTNQSEPSTINEVFLIVDDEIPVGTDILYYIVTDNNDRIPIVPNGYTPLSLTEEMTGTIKLKADFKTNGNSSAKIYSYALMYFDNIIDNQLGLKEPNVQKGVRSNTDSSCDCDAHAHDNKDVLDNLNASHGRLQYNGVDVCSGDGEVTIEYLNNNYYNKTATDYTLTSKVDKIEGKYLSTNDYTNEDKYKLTNLQNYIHPEEPEIRHVSDREKEIWNSKAEGSHSHSEYNYTTQLNELNVNKYDDISIEGTELSLKANGVIKKTVTLPASEDVTEKHTHDNKETLDNITEAKVSIWDNKSNFSGSYNDLTNKPTIPVVTNDLTAALKTNYDTAYTHSQTAHAPSTAQKNSDITKAEIESKLTGEITTHTHSYAGTTHTHLKADVTDFTHTHLKADVTDFAHTHLKADVTDFAHTHLKANITDFPAIPTKTSELSNDSGFLTSIPSDTMVTTNIVGTTLTLTTSKYQKTTMVSGTTIVLPTVSSFTEIHLFFSTTADLTLTFPSVKWQTTPSIVANKDYEIIFTYTDKWLGGVVQYG